MGLDAFPLDQPWLAIPVLLGAGFLTSLTPCLYPMIPITVAILGREGAARKTRVGSMLSVASYVLGLALVYATLGLVAGLTGSLFGAISSSPWAYGTMATVLMVAGLIMLDALPLPMPTGLLTWAARHHGDTYPAIFAMGAVSGLVAAPCGAPAFAAVLIWVGSTQSAAWGFVYLFAFSLGMTALLVVVGLAAGLGAALPRAGNWMVWVKRLSGLTLIGMAAYYFVRVGSVL